MFSHFSIGRKISLGFAIVILCTISAFYVTNDTFVESQKINKEITDNHNPSIAKLEELKLMIVRSKMLINNWVYQETPLENEDKVALNLLTDQEYPALKTELDQLSASWQDSAKTGLDSLWDSVEILWNSHAEIKEMLTGVESYNEALSVVICTEMVAGGGEVDVLTDEILDQLNQIIRIKKSTTKEITDKMINQFQFLRALIRNLGFGLTLAGIIIAFLTTRTIVSPVRKLRLILLDLSKGIFPKHWVASRGDEIGEMANALETVVTGLRRTKDFAFSVGSGSYDSNYKPLSDQDELGLSLLVMRKNLKEYSEDMEEKVRENSRDYTSERRNRKARRTNC